MAKRGRKKLLELDLEGRDRLSNELRKFLNAKLGSKHPYLVVLGYADNELKGVGSVMFGTINEKTSLYIFKLITAVFVNSAQELLNKFSFQNVGSQKDGIEQVKKGDEK